MRLSKKSSYMIRFFDIFFSLTSLIVLSPFFLIICLVLKFTGEGEVFYSQKRVGLGLSLINIYKFATMKKNSEFIGTGTLTVKNDPRILPLGIFLRDTKLNELPQLLNILKGDMSIIGPRPQTEESFSMFPENSIEILKSLKPGLSGIGSIIFSKEEEILEDKEDPIFFYKNYIAPYKASLEKWFLKNRNLLSYFMLIFLTIFVVITKRNNLPYYFYDLPEIPDKLKDYLN